MAERWHYKKRHGNKWDFLKPTMRRVTARPSDRVPVRHDAVKNRLGIKSLSLRFVTTPRGIYAFPLPSSERMAVVERRPIRMVI